MSADWGRAELEEVEQLVRAVARSAVMPHFRRLDPEDVETKSGPLDLVTVADREAEAMLTHGLQSRFPGIVVVGEEATAVHPSLTDRIADAELCAILDPIDGTSNFIAGLPLFATMVAICVRGETVGSIIHDPVGDDTALALRGGGAWLDRRGGDLLPLAVAPPVPVGKMAGALSWRFLPEPTRSRVCARMARLAGAWDYRCAAHQYRMMAAGFCHFVAFNRLLPWDHAAGVLLCQEAGAHVARLDGSAYSPASSEGGLIAAPDPTSWAAVKDTLFGPD